MTELEKVIRDLPVSIRFAESRGYGSLANIMRDALTVLKAQEPVMHSSRRGTNRFSLVWTCGKCGADLEPNNIKARYCSSCGQAVKWE